MGSDPGIRGSTANSFPGKKKQKSRDPKSLPRYPMTGPQDLAQTRGRKRADAGMTTSSVRRLVKYVWLQNEGDTGDPTRGRDPAGLWPTAAARAQHGARPPPALNPLTWQDPWTLDFDRLLVPLVRLLRVLNHLIQLLTQLKKGTKSTSRQLHQLGLSGLK